MKQKDLVLISFPYSNLSQYKLRPAIIISNNTYNDRSEDVLAVPVTSVIKNEPYSVIIGQKDLSSGRLITQSRIKIDKIFSLEKNLIKMKIGTISNVVFEKIKKDIISLIS